MSRYIVGIVGCALAALGVVAGAQQTSAPQSNQPPKFTATVEVTPVDVTVVDDHGRPIQNLTPADFTIRIDNVVRKVVSAEWISLVSESKESAEAPPVPEGYSSNAHTTGGRLILIAIDQPNIRFGGARGISKAVGDFVDHLRPSDRVAVVGLGLGGYSTTFTSDRARIKDAIGHMAGQRHAQMGSDIRVSLSEAVMIVHGDPGALDGAVARECAGMRPPQLDVCRSQIESAAADLAQNANQEAQATIQQLRDILAALKAINAPKTLILVSEGFTVPDSNNSQIIDLGAAAAEARTSLYAIKLDDQLFDASDARSPLGGLVGDRAERSAGLETLAGATRGALFTVNASGAQVFDRIEAEISGYYLLGLEAEPRDRDGKPHPIKVDVPRKGVLVRARRMMLMASPVDARPKSAREGVAAGLNSPLLMSGLPLQVTSFAYLGPDRSKVQLLIHADVGTDYTGPQRVSVGFMIQDRTGRVVQNNVSDARIGPQVNGVPSPLQYVIGATVDPGDYVLKIAVADGEKVGSVEHPIHAALVEAAGVTLTDLTVGGATDPEAVTRPTIGHTVNYGMLHGYLEAYGPAVSKLSVKYEVAADATSKPILEETAPATPGGDNRVILSRIIQVRSLPPGNYVLRAVVTSGTEPIKTLTRTFEIAPPPVLMTSAADSGGSSTPDMFLPVDEESISHPFRRDDAVKAEVLKPFEERLAPGSKDAFDKAVSSLKKGDYVAAENGFKQSMNPDVDSTPGLAYLAVAFAASGHDVEAANAWQTALVDGGDIPQIYDWLSGALLRSRDLTTARSVLEEAAGKWPADPRFTRPLALVYAAFGRGREAVRTLQRYIAEGHDDPDTLFLAMQWLFQIHVNGAVAQNRAEDLKNARDYAARYAKANGPKQPLVQQWLDYIAKQK